MKNKFLEFALIICLLFSQLVVVTATDTSNMLYLINQNFDNIPLGIVRSAGANTTVTWTNDETSTGGTRNTWAATYTSNMLEIINEGLNNNYLNVATSRAFVNFAEQSKGTIVAEFRLKSQPSTAINLGQVWIGDGTNKGFNMSLSKNTLSVYDGSTSKTVTSAITPDTWYNFKVASYLTGTNVGKFEIYYGADALNLTKAGPFAFNSSTLTKFNSIYINPNQSDVICRVDNLKVYKLLEPPTQIVFISPQVTAAKPSLGQNTVQYTTKITDQYSDEVINQPIIWSLDKNTTGVSIDQAGLVTISDSAVVGNKFIVKAALSNYSNISTQIEVTVLAPEIAKIEIIGTDTAVIPLGESNNYTYTATVYDQFNVVVPDVEVEWTSSPIAIQNGRLTITKDDSDSTIQIVATVKNKPTVKATKNVTLEKEKVASVLLDGPSIATIAPSDVSNFNYTATVLNQINVPVIGEGVIWNVTGDLLDGITLTNGVLSVNPLITNRIITIEAKSSTDNTKYAQKQVNVQRQVSVATEIVLTGSEKIDIPSRSIPLTSTYTAIIKDQYGVIMPNEAVEWALESNTGAVIDTNGVLSVTNNCSQGTVKVAVESKTATAKASMYITLVKPTKNTVSVGGGGGGGFIPVLDKTASNIKNSIVLLVNSKNAMVNGEQKLIDSLSNTSPIIVDNRTLVPVRFISESCGFVVEWNQETMEIKIKSNNKNITMTIGSKIIYENDKAITIDVPAQIINERTFIPIRAMSEAIDKNVLWDDRGLIVISDKAYALDVQNDKIKIDELYNKLK